MLLEHPVELRIAAKASIQRATEKVRVLPIQTEEQLKAHAVAIGGDAEPGLLVEQSAEVAAGHTQCSANAVQ